MRIFSYLTIFLLAVSFLGRPIYDPDLGWQLYGGQFILRNLTEVFYTGQWDGWVGILPQKDPINFLNNDWHDYHWLAQIVFAALYELGGISLLMLFLPIVVFWTLLIIYRLLKKTLPEGHGVIIWLLIISFNLLLYKVSSVRPQMLSILLISAALSILLDNKSSYRGAKLFALTVLIANFHVYWIFVPVLYLCLEILKSKWVLLERKNIYFFLLLSSAGLFTPYSLGSSELNLYNLLINYSLLYDYLFIPEVLKKLVSEFQGAYSSINLLTVLTFCAYLLISSFSFLKKVKYTPGELVLLLLSLLLPLSSAKYLPLQIIFLLPALIKFIQQLNLTPLSFRSELFLLLFFLCYVSIPIFPAISNWQNSNEQIIEQQPVNACAKIARVAIRQPTKVATFFDHGGWCRFAAAQIAWDKKIQVSTDGRTQGVGNQRYLESLELFAAKNNWSQTLQKWQPDFILVPRYVKLLDELLKIPEQYPAVYADQRFVVFLNKKLYPEFN